MLTNTKLLQEITAMTQENNEVLREKLKQQILEGTSNMNRSVLHDFSEKYHAEFKEMTDQFGKQHDELLKEFNEISKKQSETLTSKFAQAIAESNQAMAKQIAVEYCSKLEDLRNDINGRMSAQYGEMQEMIKALSINLNNLQRDNAIIMETLQLILTNLLIDGVNQK